MKFKTLFFLFNFILLLSFAFIFLMPLPVLGWEYALSFWKQNWLIAVLFIVVLGGIDSYFFVQWPLYRRLEREDWSGLKDLLESQWKHKGRLSLGRTRIYLNSLLIEQKPNAIAAVRLRCLENRSKFLPKIALSLGLPLVLEGNADGIEEFFGPLVENKKAGGDLPWIRWSVGFGRLLKKDADGARPLLERGLTEKKNPLLRLLSLYLLENCGVGNPEVAARVEQERLRLKTQFTPKEWQSHHDGLKEKIILVLFMEKLIADARTWLAQPAKENPQ